VSRPALGPTQPPVQWVPGVLSLGVKRGRGVMLTTHPHLAPRLRMSRSYTSSPASASMACSGTGFVVLSSTFGYPKVKDHEPGSSGSIVSDYGLDDRAIEVRSPAGAKYFSSILCVQTSSGAHPASCSMGTGVLSPGVKRGRGVMLTTHPHLVPRSRMSKSYTSSPPKRLNGV
jgi:hypothetical protein